MSGLDPGETLRLASAALGEQLTSPAELGGSSRSLVLRARSADGGTVVVKRFGPPDDGEDLPYEREAAGLAALDHTPDLLAADPRHALLVMTDAGAAPTLADLLRGADPGAAWQGAMRWARALGELCASSTPAVPDLARRLPARTAEDVLDRVRSGAARIAEVTGAVAGEGLAAELGAVRAVLDERSTLVASPGDTCPDNVLMEPDGRVVFLDLEGTSVHHPALDAAYALLPFATCWCVYAPPEGFVEGMLASFTEGLTSGAPSLVGDSWDRQVRAACLGWLLIMSGVLLRYADDADRRLGPPERPALTFRQHLLLRWRWGARHLAADFPVAASFLATAATRAEAIWAAPPAPPYPAFAT